MNEKLDKQASHDPLEATPAWLKAHIDAMPNSFSPSRDLWPEIAQAMSRPVLGEPKRRFSYALAAGLVMMGLSFIFSWQSYQQQKEIEWRLAEAERVMRQIEAPYQYAQLSYQEAWPAMRAQLSAETAETIDANLKLIQHAQAQIRQALNKEPNDTALHALLNQSMGQELTVYKHAEKALQKTTLI